MEVLKKKDANTTSTSNDFTYFGRSLKGEVMLIGGTATHLNDYFWGEYSWNIPKNIQIF